jgi:23S rRNA (uracil1939-C5)-methyltransferase
MKFEALIPLYGGYTLSRGDGVVFLRGAIPGEIVDADVVEKKRDYSIASVKEIVESSPYRQNPPCPVFGICGGCHYQYLSYQRQVRLKEEITGDTLNRIGKVEAPLDSSLFLEPWHYRNKAQFKIDKKGKIGFYRAFSHDVVEFDECLLLTSELNSVLREIKSRRVPGGVHEIHLQSGDIILALAKGKRFDFRDVSEWLMDCGVAGVVSEDKEVCGANQMSLDLKGYSYRVSPGAFFQVNWLLNEELVSLLTDIVSNIRPKRVLDLYAGAGNFSLPLSPHAKEIISVEENTISVNDGQDNIHRNGIDNIRFVNKKVEAYKWKKPADLMILDPPRTGISRNLIEMIRDSAPDWIIYVSCNPSTFARDISQLHDIYSIESIRVVDMFPQTFHIETFSVLKREDG